MSKAVLHYWAGRGRAETLRLMMAATGVEWTEKHFTEPEQLDELRASGKLAFNQLPLLEIDGLNLVQSMSTVRYLARKGGMSDGKDSKKEAIVDMYTEGARDFLSPFLGKGFSDGAAFDKNIKATIDKYMPFFEKILAANTAGQGHLFGNSITVADVCLMEVLLLVEEVDAHNFDKYPNCLTFLNSMKGNDKIAKYLASSNRYKWNTPEYCASVKKVLRW